jgi:hypothetical protein
VSRRTRNLIERQTIANYCKLFNEFPPYALRLTFDAERADSANWRGCEGAFGADRFDGHLAANCRAGLASGQRAMAQEAEALREKRARLIKAEAELDAAALRRRSRLRRFYPLTLHGCL